MTIDELETPAVLVDLDVMERNLARLASYTRKHSLTLRPHTKTHKIPELARRQIESGAKGITVAKPGEARVMAEGGLRDIMIAYPLVTEAKARVAAELARNSAICVSMDSVEALDVLSQAGLAAGRRIGALVEIDVGFHRCGVDSPEQALSLARHAAGLSGLEFRGLMFYPGQLGKLPDEQTAGIADVNRCLTAHYEAFQNAGVEIPVVSGGSTATAYRSHEFAGVNEIRPGMYIFNDRNLVSLGACSLEDCALHVMVTVVSTAVPGRTIVDGGSKTFSSDRSKGEKVTYGLIREDSQTDFIALSEEHGHLDTTHSDRSFQIGERLHILPNHVCVTVNMHDQIYGVRGNTVEKVWQVKARGKVQ
jgi:D-serine deaminase-like pyridoxal phosphate-dependent protein